MFVFELFFFFNDTATTEIYTLSLHDALPISPQLLDVRQDEVEQRRSGLRRDVALQGGDGGLATPDQLGDDGRIGLDRGDRKSTRLNSSHANISYAVFCLKKKKLNTSSFTNPE